MDVLLQIEGLSKNFLLHQMNRSICGCKDITISVRPGEFVGITGRSGSGKSTILRSIYRTNLPEQGAVWYDSARFGAIDILKASEREVVYLRRYEIGYISQFLRVLPRTTAYDIVLQSALETGGAKPAATWAQTQTERLLRHFNLPESLWGLYPLTFSGGEKLRLNIAAAMIKKPRLLLDEPTASLDNDSKLKVRELIERLKQDGCTMLGIFHDLEFMDGLCDCEYNMEKGGFSKR